MRCCHRRRTARPGPARGIAWHTPGRGASPQPFHLPRQLYGLRIRSLTSADNPEKRREDQKLLMRKRRPQLRRVTGSTITTTQYGRAGRGALAATVTLLAARAGDYAVLRSIRPKIRRTDLCGWPVASPMARYVAPPSLMARIRSITAISSALGTSRGVSPSSTTLKPKGRFPPLNMAGLRRAGVPEG
jgi:hypothetical protein